MPKGVPDKRYTPEFKQKVVEAVVKEGLRCQEAARLYEVNGQGRIQSRERIYLQEFDSMEHLKREWMDDLDDYNNYRIKSKRKGLPPAIHRQQALSAAWTIFTLKYYLTFWGQFKDYPRPAVLFFK